MEEKISEYYRYFARGKFLSLSKTRRHLLNANEELLKAINIKETKEAYVTLINNCFKLRDYAGAIKYSEAIKGKYDGFGEAALGVIYTQSKENEDFLKGVENYESAIKNFNNAGAYINLSKMYRDGLGVKQDLNKAKELLNEALAIKDIEKRGELESMLASILFLEKNYEKSFELYKAAIEHGYPQAHSSLAVFYREGLFVEKDLDAYLDHLLAWSTEQTLWELGGIYLENKLTAPDNFIFESCMFHCARSFNNVSAYFMLAAIESAKEEPNKELINEYLSKGFEGKNNLEDLQGVFLAIEETLGKQYADLIRQLAKQYWKVEKHTA